MSRSLPDWTSLWSALSTLDHLEHRFLSDADYTISLQELARGSSLYERGDDLSGRSVLVATTNQLTTISALIELDGIANRIILCPPDFSIEHLAYVIETAAVDAIVSDRPMMMMGSQRRLYFSPCSRTIVPGKGGRPPRHATQWVLLTSGTTGVPKLVVHTLASLAGAIAPPADAETDPRVWSTFYDIRRYGGLQIFLRCILTGMSLVLSSPQESTSDFLSRAASLGVTHISGTPSHWRRALMSQSAHQIAPQYVRLSGEIANQALLNQLRCTYPLAHLVHAFASTEAGVVFEVQDGMEGVPISTIGNGAMVESKVEDNSLRVRSSRTASCYLGALAPRLKDADGFVDTGDLLEMRDDRYYFVGRRDGVINVGGLKVYPEEIEAVINRHPAVQMSMVRARKHSLTGSLVVADVVLHASGKHDLGTLQNDILLHCRENLSAYKVPAAINFIPALTVSQSGKVLRRNA